MYPVLTRRILVLKKAEVYSIDGAQSREGDADLTAFLSSYTDGEELLFPIAGSLFLDLFSIPISDNSSVLRKGIPTVSA